MVNWVRMRSCCISVEDSFVFRLNHAFGRIAMLFWKLDPIFIWSLGKPMSYKQRSNWTTIWTTVHWHAQEKGLSLNDIQQHDCIW